MRLIFSSPKREMSVPFSRTWPLVGASKPPRIYNNVLFPEPDGPMMDTNSPCITCKEMSFKTSVAVFPTRKFLIICLPSTAIPPVDCFIYISSYSNLISSTSFILRLLKIGTTEPSNVTRIPIPPAARNVLAFNSGTVEIFGPATRNIV